MAVQDGRDPGTDAYDERVKKRRLRNKRRAARATGLSKKAKSAGGSRKAGRRAL